MVSAERSTSTTIRRVGLEGRDLQRLLAEMIEKVEAHPRVTVLRGSEVREVAGYVGNYRTVVGPRHVGGPEGTPGNGGAQTIEHGIVAVLGLQVAHQRDSLRISATQGGRQVAFLDALLEFGDL